MSATKPIIDPVPSLLTRLTRFVQTWLFKIVTTAIFGGVRVLRPKIFQAYAPTYTKIYPTRPNLTCRVFIPKSYHYHPSSTTSEAVDKSKLLPLYIDIHGGGYFGGNPSLDDKVCHYICNTFNRVIVSIQYRLAPTHPFPAGLDDCTELILAILKDDELPVDHTGSVVIGGQSAGAGMALAVGQDEKLRSTGRIGGLMCFYPPTDFSHVYDGDYRDRPVTMANGKQKIEKDGLRPVKPLANWAYPAYGQDRTDPRLSPVYAKREVLPKRIYFVAAQYDILCEEAFVMAKGLVGGGDLTEEKDWERDGIRWERVPDEVHGFVEAGWRDELFPKEGQLPWNKVVKGVLGRVGEWLDDVQGA